MTQIFPLNRHTSLDRLAEFKRPRVLDNQKISEDNQELRPGCPPDYQMFCEIIDQKEIHPNKSLTLSFSFQQKQQYEN